MSTQTAHTGAATNAPLQFDTAHPGNAVPALSCASCHEPVRSVYYAVNTNVVCSRCRGKLETRISSAGGGRRFGRAFGFGMVAAIAGAIFYYGFREVTGIDFGLVAVLVGFMVGKAVFVGTEQRGGRRYQFLAAALTYFAIASTYLPVVLKEAKAAQTASKDSLKAAVRSDSSVTGASVSGDSTLDETAVPTVSAHTTTGKMKAKKLGFGIVLLAFAGMILFTAALPIIVGFSSIISVVILGIGLLQAWRMNRAVQFVASGPYRIAGLPEAEPAT